jgi:glucose/mannose transport system permease protein
MTDGFYHASGECQGSRDHVPSPLADRFTPYQSILIPLVRSMQTIGLYGKLWGLVLAHVIYGIPITTLIFRNYYASVPTEMVEAAHIDGAGLLGIYRHEG